MILNILFALLVVLVGFLIHLFVEERYKTLIFTSTRQSNSDKLRFEEPYIKVYGKLGVEWIVKGTFLEVQNNNVKLAKAVLISNQGDTVKADTVVLDRFSGVGVLEGNVVLESKEIYVQTDTAKIDLKNNLISGESKVYVKGENKIIQGKGYEISLKPLRVIINNVYTEIK